MRVYDMQTKFHLKIALALLLFVMIGGCEKVNSVHVHKVSFKSLDSDIDAIIFSTCSSRIEIEKTVQLWTYSHSDCSNYDYSVKVVYSDSYILEESLGYIPGGVDITHDFLLENRKLSLQDWTPVLVK
jgi:hypothetical protein